MADFFRVFLVTFFASVPHYILCSVPFFPDLRVKKRTVLGMIIATGVVYAACYAALINFVPGWQRLNAPFLIAFYLLYLIQYKRYFQITLSKLIYVFLVVQAYSNMLNMAAKFIDVRLFPDHLPIYGAYSYGLIVVGLMAATYPFLFRFFRSTFSKVFHEYPDKGFWKLCITPVLFFVINMLFTSMLQAQAYAQVDLFALYLMLMTTGLITYYLTLRTGVDMAGAIEARAQMEGQLALQAQHYRQLTEGIERARAARHDLRHHLSVLSAYANSGDMAGLQAYLREYTAALPEDAMAVYCENYAVNAVAQHYLGLAKAQGAEVDVRFQLPQDAGIPDSELCIVFGNILENAAQSCARQQSGPRTIRARCEAGQGRIVIVLDNSTDGAETQPDGHRGQGLGLKSVRAVAEKWGGSLTVEREGGWYKTSVVLMTGRL